MGAERDAVLVSRRGHVARSVALLAYAAAVFLRLPRLLTEPRLWGEEGSVYLADALATGWRALFHTHQDYLSAVANLAACLASAAPLEAAPHVTTGVAFVVQLVPPAIVLWGLAPIWRHPGARAAGVALTLLTLSSAENWLTSISSQFYLGLAAFLVLLEPAGAARSVRLWLQRACLVIAGLAGPPAAFLTPAAIVRAWGSGCREAWLRAALLGSCGLLQASIYLVAALDALGPSRLRGLGAEIPALVAWTKTVVLPLAGSSAEAGAGSELIALAHSSPGAFTVLARVGALLLLLLLVLAARRSRDAATCAVAYAGVLVPSVLFAGGTHVSPVKIELLMPLMGQRYFFLPTVIALVLALSLATGRRAGPSPPRVLRIVCLVIVTAALVTGALEYRSSMHRFEDRGPPWSSEITRWRSDPMHRPAIWPEPWTVELPRSPR